MPARPYELNKNSVRLLVAPQKAYRKLKVHIKSPFILKELLQFGRRRHGLQPWRRLYPNNNSRHCGDVETLCLRGKFNFVA